MFSWLDFVIRSGPAGREWAAEYQRYNAVDRNCRRALVDLREGDAVGARRLLDEAASISAASPPTIRGIHDRWRFGAEAYYHYRRGDFELAEEHLDNARHGLAGSIGAAPFLIALGGHFEDFEVQKARCARERRAWQVVAAHLDTARGMVVGQRPMCVLDDGRAIYMSAVERFYTSFELSESEREDLETVIDVERHLSAFERHARSIWLLPGFVIADP
jgi:hypothetical protein